jgi:hypothetical protein
MALALAGCAHQPRQRDDDDTDLYIQLSYPYQMLDHTRELAELRDSTPDVDTRNNPRELARVLRQTVWEYDAESSSLCARGLYTDVSCLPALNPPWLYESAKAAPSAEELLRRAEWVQERMGALWDAACADFRERHPEVKGEGYMEHCSVE